jgi:hypothetical protein
LQAASGFHFQPQPVRPGEGPDRLVLERVDLQFSQAPVLDEEQHAADQVPVLAKDRRLIRNRVGDSVVRRLLVDSQLYRRAPAAATTHHPGGRNLLEKLIAPVEIRMVQQCSNDRDLLRFQRSRRQLAEGIAIVPTPYDYDALVPASDAKKTPRSPKRSCFVVSAFGATPEDQRRHKQVLRHLVRKVLGDRFDVVRADEIDEEGLITNQIIEHLLDDDLVVADLTGLNPNVFYEVAVRHAVQKPIVHLITSGEEIPFDVANMRAVPYALDDPDALEAAQEELARKVKSIEEADWVAAPNPISAAREVSLLQSSEQPEARAAGDILSAVGELRDEVRALSRRVPSVDAQRVQQSFKGPSIKEMVIQYLIANGPSSIRELRESIPASEDSVRRVLHQLAERAM